ncbi:hypothetical protein Syun_026771 [Stephania yunnanensis]|uniref:Uncharacterized protein n=1 Tax=Stephania yunnanensis TaxID=152371 RepID=A0AAP0HQN9_9MAGN
MPEARDRLVREQALEFPSARPTIGSAIRHSLPGTQMGASMFLFSAGADGGAREIGSPMLRSRLRVAAIGGFGSPVTGARSPGVGMVAGSRVRRGGLRARRSPLPAWYPRTPLRDITAVVRALERQRARNQDSGHPLQPESSVSDITAANKHDISMATPVPTTAKKGSRLPVLSKILLDIHDAEDSTMTPQKKLLNKIGEVEKVVMEEIQMMKKSPAAKRAEKERKARTLMSMR